MSSTTSTTRVGTTTVSERTTAATRDLCATLGIGDLSSANAKHLALALALVAGEEAARNGEFAARLREAYQALVPAKAPAPRKAAPAGDKRKIRLTPVGVVDESELDPYGPPNPFALQKLYGNDQLRLALERYSLTALKETLPAMQERFPGTKPKKITKPGIIDYIVEYLVGAGH